MKKTILVFIILGLLSFLWSCKPSMEVIHISNSDEQIKCNGIIYHLPRTVFEVEVELNYEVLIPGPFNKYANKYLSITSVPFQEEESYSIDEIKVSSLSEPDPDAAFLIKSKKSFPQISFSNRNLIQGVNIDDFVTESPAEFLHEKSTCIPNDELTEPFFTDLSVKRNFINMLDTTYKVIEIDSVYQKIPVYNNVITSKELEQKAEEAANYIIKIRKRRFKLEAGMYEVFPDGRALKQMLKELDELEQEYLSLFVGKKYVFDYSYKETFVPEKQLEKKDIILFWFSEEEGISKNETALSRPIYLNCEALPQTKTVESFYKQQNEYKPKYNGLYYRIPGKCRIIIKDGEYIMSNDIFDVAQFGLLNSLPINMFKKSSPSILYVINSGSIINIQ